MSVSSEMKTVSRPISIAPPRAPALRDILQNQSSPPYTLSAFTAYLSQKQCLENLEFTIDAKRYAQRFDELSAEMTGIPMTDEVDECRQLVEDWQRLLDAYITSGAPKEVNLPDHIRRDLLKLHPDRQGPAAAPPAPELLEEATEHIVELMDESIMMGFISEHALRVASHGHQSVSSGDYGMMGLDSDDERRMRNPSRLGTAQREQHRSRSRRNHSPELQTGESARLQTNLPASTSRVSIGQGPGHSASRASVGSASGSADANMMDVDSIPSSPSDMMTPPTTPPGADLAGEGSPRQNQNPWRKMMGKLGTKKRSASRMER